MSNLVAGALVAIISLWVGWFLRMKVGDAGRAHEQSIVWLGATLDAADALVRQLLWVETLAEKASVADLFLLYQRLGELRARVVEASLYARADVAERLDSGLKEIARAIKKVPDSATPQSAVTSAITEAVTAAAALQEALVREGRSVLRPS